MNCCPLTALSPAPTTLFLRTVFEATILHVELSSFSYIYAPWRIEGSWPWSYIPMYAMLSKMNLFLVSTM